MNILKHISQKHISLVLLLALNTQALGDATAASSDANPNERYELQKKVNATIARLRVGIFRGSLVEMEQQAAIINGILEKKSESEVAGLCDYECHYQLALFEFFRGSDLPFLSEKLNTSTDVKGLKDPAKIAEFADRGIFYAERGLKLLASQQAVTPQSADTTDANARVLRTYLRQSALLNSMKVKLYILKGDAYYRSISQGTLVNLGKALTKSLDDTSAPDNKSEFSRAKAYYEQASWTLIEGRTDLPQETEEFADLANEFSVLEGDLNLRLTSIDRGNLFLGVDPEEYSTMSTKEIGERLGAIYNGIIASESKIAAIINEWASKNDNGNATAIDEKRFVQSQSMDLSAHKIALLDEQSRALQDDIEHNLKKINNEKDVHAQAQLRRQARAEFEVKIREMENEKASISARSELDLLALTYDKTSDKRQEIRWLIDLKFAQTSLELQVQSLQVQVAEYDRQQAKNIADIEILKSQTEQKASARKVADQEILKLESEITKLKAKSTANFELQKSVTQEQINAIDANLNALTSIKQVYLDSICELRKTKNTNDEKVFTDLLACVETSVCNGAESEKASIEALKSHYKSYFTSRKTEIAALVTNRQTQIEALESFLTAYETAKNSNDKKLNIAIGANITANALPTVGGTVGLAAGVTTTVDPGRIAQSALDKIQSDINRSESWEQIKASNADAIKALKTAKADMEDENAKLTAEDAVNRLTVNQTMAALTYRIVDLKGRIQEVKDRAAMEVVECTNDKADNESKKAQLEINKKELANSLSLLTADNALIAYDIAQREADILIQKSIQDSLEEDRKQLQIQIAQLTKDQERIEGMKKQVHHSIATAKSTQTTTAALASESQKITDLLNVIREKQKAGTLGLAATQLAGLNSVITQTAENAAKADKEFETQLNDLQLEKEFQQKLADTRATYSKAILEERNNLLETARKVASQTSPDEKVDGFFATEAVLSKIFRGVPEYLNAKRNGLSAANYGLGILQRRADLLVSLAGDRPTSQPITYITSSSDFKKLMEPYCSFIEVSGIGSQCDETQNVFKVGSPVGLNYIDLTVPANSGFVKSLANNGRVDFEFKYPSGLTQEESQHLMQDNGYLQLTPYMSNLPAPVLVDILVGINYNSDSCGDDQSNKVAIRHKGTGVKFYGTGANLAPMMVNLQPKWKEQTVYRFPTYQPAFTGDLGSLSQIETFTTSFDNDWDAQPKKRSRSYLGLPLYGQYEMVRSVSNPNCSLDKAEIHLGFVYASGSTPF